MMNKLTSIDWFGRWTAAVSFGIGTTLLIIYLIFKAEAMLVPSYIFVVFSAIFNMVVLLFLVVNLFINTKRWKGFLTTIGIMLLNIPIVFLYLMLLFGF